MIPLTHTQFAWVGLDWSRSRLEAQRSPWMELVVRGVNALGCKARVPRRRTALRVSADDPSGAPFATTLPGGDAYHNSICGLQRP